MASGTRHEPLLWTLGLSVPGSLGRWAAGSTANLVVIRSEDERTDRRAAHTGTMADIRFSGPWPVASNPVRQCRSETLHQIVLSGFRSTYLASPSKHPSKDLDFLTEKR